MTIRHLPTITSVFVAGLVLATGSALGQQGQSNQRQNDASDRSVREPNSDRNMSDLSRNSANSRRDREQWNRDDAERNRRRQWDDDERNDTNQNAGLGVTVVDTNQGVRVRQVMQDSPADQAGIRPGDEILSLNGRQLNDSEQLIEVVKRQQPGDRVEIKIDRNGRQQTVAATLESRREALNLEEQVTRSQRFYRGGSPPWGSDDLRQHVAQLQRQVQMLQRDLNDLRDMLDDDPSQREFAGMNSGRRTSTRERDANTRSRDSRNYNADSDRDYDDDSRTRSNRRASDDEYDRDDSDRRN